MTQADRPPSDRGLTPELWSLIDKARARRRQSQPLENRWYPEDRPGTVYTKAGDDSAPQPERKD